MIKASNQTGAPVTHVLSSPLDARPVVGMSATILSGANRHAATIAKVSMNEKFIWVQRDFALRTDTNGMSKNQEYTYTPDTAAFRDQFRFYKSGWRRIAADPRGQGECLVLGTRETYYDYSL